MESTNSEFENLDTPDSFFSAPDKLTNIISRAIINIKNSESNHPPRAKKNYKNPCSLCHKQVRENQKAIQCNNCDNWVHAKCDGTTNKEYQQLRLEADDVPYFLNHYDFNPEWFGTELLRLYSTTICKKDWI